MRRSLAAIPAPLLLLTSLALAAPPPQNPIPVTLPTTDFESHTKEFYVTYPIPPAPLTSPIVRALYLRAGCPVQSRVDLLSHARAFDDRAANAFLFARHPPGPIPSAAAPWLYRCYVPPDYRPGQPYGLLVYVSPNSHAGIPKQYQSLCDHHRLIAITPELAGNERYPLLRIYLALESVLQARLHFTLDPERTYIAGMSGGARVASQAALYFPDVFTGMAPMCGTDYYRNLIPPDQPDKFYAGFCPKLDPALLDLARQYSRLALLTGTRDQNRAPTELAADAFHQDGFAHVAYFEVDGAGHAPSPPADLDRALAFLDSPFLPPDQLLAQSTTQSAQHPGTAYMLAGRAATLSTDDALTQRAKDAAQSLFHAYTQEATHIAPNSLANKTFHTRWSPFTPPPPLSKPPSTTSPSNTTNPAN